MSKPIPLQNPQPAPDGDVTVVRLRIVAADDEPDMRAFFRKMLPHLGYDVLGVAENGRELVEMCGLHRPDLIVTDIDMPELDGLEALERIAADRTIPAIAVTAHSDAGTVERAARSAVMAVLVKPIEKHDLPPAIELAMQRFREFEALRQQAVTPRQAFEDRPLIERAKAVLMKRAGLNESDAFRRLQKLASDKNRKLIDIARTLIEAEDAFQ